MAFKDLAIAKKLIIVLNSSVLILLVVMTFFVTSYLTRTLEEQNVVELTKTNNMAIAMVSAYNRSLEYSADKLGNMFAAFFPEKFRLDESSLVTVGNKATPELKSGGGVLNLNYGTVDRFQALTGGVATIFARSGEDFIRISTSLRKENGERAIGTPLDRTHPAYERVKKGEIYIGKARLFGKDYMTKYLPVKDEGGKVVGILFTGMDFTDGLKDLKDKMRSIKIGDTGYLFAIDAKEGKELGKLMLHPTLEGDSVLELKDANGKEFVKEMLAKKNGVIHYPYMNAKAGDTSPRSKIVVYSHFKEWDWLIATNSFVDEATKSSTLVRHAQIIATIAMMLLMILVISYACRIWITQPLTRAVAALDRFAEGNIREKIEVDSKDEIGHMFQAMRNMAQSLGQLIRQVHETSGHLTQDSAKLAGTADRVVKSSQAQSDAASSMAAAVEQAATGTSSISDSANELLEHSHQSRDKVLAGNRSLTELIAAVNSAEAAVKEIAETVQEFVRNTASITTFTGELTEIANQTNLLALNAAIEAARAGEQGRGFAVVADEVRKLAEKSALSASEIDKITQSIDAQSKMVVSSIDKGTRSLHESKMLMDNVTAVITDASHAVDSTTDGINAITSSVREESTAINDIARNVERVANMVEENTVSINQVSDEARKLDSLAKELRQGVSRFSV